MTVKSQSAFTIIFLLYPYLDNGMYLGYIGETVAPKPTGMSFLY